MTKPQTQKTLTITEIFESIQTLGLDQTRQNYQAFTGARITVSGKIEKIIKRGGQIKLLIQAEMKVICDFSEKADFLLHIKKGQTVSVSGNFQSFGFESICLDKCQVGIKIR